MNTFIPTLNVVANAFYLAAAGLGLPSGTALGLYGCYSLKTWLTPVSQGTSFPKYPDAILLMLKGLTSVIGGLAQIVNRVSLTLFKGVAIASGFLLIFALALFLIGRGLHAQQSWARGSAGFVTAGFFLTSLFSLTAFRGPLFLLSLVFVIASASTLCGLWRGFSF